MYAYKFSRREDAMANELDLSLIHEVRRLMDGANIHRVKTWLFCYENSEPNSKIRQSYEQLLRNFVVTRRYFF